MIKRDEGYALPFVLVVLLVLVALAVAIMDTSLRNLESQKATIQRMEAKYEAAGEIEKIFAAIHSDIAGISFPQSNKLDFGKLNGENFLRVAASHGENEEEQILWVIAALKPSETNWTPGITGKDPKKNLTVQCGGTVEYLLYEVVDKETAKAFIAGDYPEGGVS